MQKAKQAAANFLSRDGKHNTTVDQDVRPAVTDEHVRPHEHQIVTTAIDKEVHQDHHQTRIQPIKATETLPEKSTHVVNPIQHAEYEHGNEAELRAKLDQDAANYKDSSVTHETTHSAETAAAIAGEHVHHHVHEHIQPVIHKETVAPHVVHRTVPIHETHHAAPIHHEATILPAQTLEEYTAHKSGSIQPKTEPTTLREFEGCPGPYNKDRELPNTALHPNSSGTSSHLHHHSTTGGMSNTEEKMAMESESRTEGLSKRSSVGAGKSERLGKSEGLSRSEGMSPRPEGMSPRSEGMSPRSEGMSPTETSGDTQIEGSEPNYRYTDTTSGGRTDTTSGGRTAAAAGVGGAAVAAGRAAQSTGTGSTADAAKPRSEARRSGERVSESSTGAPKASLMDKLNPLKDSDGDGKKGIMG